MTATYSIPIAEAGPIDNLLGVGSYVEPDNWGIGEKLLPSDWSGAQF